MKFLFSLLFIIFSYVNLFSGQTTTLRFLKVFSNGVYSSQARALTPFNETIKFFYNPAYNIDDRLITISYNNYNQDLKASFIGYSFNYKEKINYGIGFLDFDYGRLRQTFIDAIERPYYGNNLDGNAYVFLFNINFINQKIYNFGINAKFVRDKLFVKKAEVFLLDVGADIKLSDNYGLGLSIVNSGSKIKYYISEEAAPTSYLADFYYKKNKVLLNFGIEKYSRISELEKKISIEYELIKEIKIRCGYNSASDVINNNLSYGFSFSYKNLVLDFSYSNYSAVGEENIITLNYRF
ncbi:MAG TPA: hypothetical protein PLD27_12610 [bacterium]|nr:hypothetical protein [bacterium]HPQ20054.1 hypothetical protein [bacterium]